jgi:hypothetical protein
VWSERFKPDNSRTPVLEEDQQAHTAKQCQPILGVNHLVNMTYFVPDDLVARTIRQLSDRFLTSGDVEYALLPSDPNMRQESCL